MNKVKEARELRGLTQRELANLVGIGAATICNIERNQHEPGVTIALKIAKGLKSTVEKLFLEEDNV